MFLTTSHKYSPISVTKCPVTWNSYNYELHKVESCPQHGSNPGWSPVWAPALFPHLAWLFHPIPLLNCYPSFSLLWSGEEREGKVTCSTTVLLGRPCHQPMVFLPRVPWGDLCTPKRTLMLGVSPLQPSWLGLGNPLCKELLLEYHCPGGGPWASLEGVSRLGLLWWRAHSRILYLDKI